MSSNDDRLIQMWDAHARERAKGLAAQLRKIADEVEREASNENRPLTLLIHDVQHTILWGFANLNLDGLIPVLHDIQQVRESSD